MLERLGCRAETVDNGRAAVEAALRETYDVVLMDVQMPELDGVEATIEIRRREAGSRSPVPIVGLTAHATTGHRDRCLAAGMDDYLTKPVNLDDLRRALDRWRGAAPEAPIPAGAPRDRYRRASGRPVSP
jgi:CheY-like chemotaxis protein